MAIEARAAEKVANHFLRLVDIIATLFGTSISLNSYVQRNRPKNEKNVLLDVTSIFSYVVSFTVSDKLKWVNF